MGIATARGTEESGYRCNECGRQIGMPPKPLTSEIVHFSLLCGKCFYARLAKWISSNPDRFFCDSVADRLSGGDTDWQTGEWEAILDVGDALAPTLGRIAQFSVRPSSQRVAIDVLAEMKTDRACRALCDCLTNPATRDVSPREKLFLGMTRQGKAIAFASVSLVAWVMFFPSLWLAGLLFGIVVGLFAYLLPAPQANQPTARRGLLTMLAELANPISAGAIAYVHEQGNQETVEILRELLPRVTERHASYFTGEEKSAICDLLLDSDLWLVRGAYLAIEEFGRGEECADIEACAKMTKSFLEQIRSKGHEYDLPSTGEPESMIVGDQGYSLRVSKGREIPADLEEVMERCLATMRMRAEHQKEGRELLRASDGTAAEAHELLRPAEGGGDDDPSTLLRPEEQQ